MNGKWRIQGKYIILPVFSSLAPHSLLLFLFFFFRAGGIGIFYYQIKRKLLELDWV